MTREVFRMVVEGEAKPQGSISAIPLMRPGKSGRRVPICREDGTPIVNIVENNKATKPWRQDVASAARLIWKLDDPLDEPLFVHLRFFRERLASDIGAKGNVLPSAGVWPETWYDLDKLQRAVLDALTGIVWKNDARVVRIVASKQYGSPSRLEVVVKRPRFRKVAQLREWLSRNDGVASVESSEGIDSDAALF